MATVIQVPHREFGETQREQYQSLASKLWSDRSSFDPHWRELAEHLSPRRTRFFADDKNRGERRNDKIKNETGMYAARTLASGLHAGLTSPARPWLKLTTPSPAMAKHKPIQVWTYTVTDILLSLFAQSNLYNGLPIVYEDMSIFGTAAMSVLPDTRDLFRVYNYPLGSYALGLNARNLITTFVYRYQLSVRQIIEEFGGTNGQKLRPGQKIDRTRFSMRVLTAWDKGAYEDTVDVTWVVLPNAEADPRRIGAYYLPFRSCHFDPSDTERNALRESGFQTFPVLCPRWAVTGDGDAYGQSCPGMIALAGVKQLQEMEKKKGQIVKKFVDPALTGPESLRSQKVSLVPGDFTPADVRDGMQGLRPIHELTLAGYEAVVNDIARVEGRVRRAFYEDVILMMQASDQQLGADRPTAREIQERHEEKLLVFGPMLERTKDELLDLLVDRVFGMAVEAGLIPPPPPELEGVDLKVEYISSLAQAQKLQGIVALDRYMQTVTTLLQFAPESKHKTDFMAAIDVIAEQLGVNPAIVRETEVASAMAAEEAQAAQAQQAADMAQKMGAGVKSLATAPLDGDTALTRMLQHVGAA